MFLFLLAKLSNSLKIEQEKCEFLAEKFAKYGCKVETTALFVGTSSMFIETTALFLKTAPLF
jgi:hypothetical protein